MNRAELNTTWLRWLDGRAVDEDIANEMIAALDTDRELLDLYLTDLEMHRQLQAMARVDAGDLAFVGRSVAHYEASLDELFASPSAPGKPVNTDQIPEADVTSRTFPLTPPREGLPPVIKVDLSQDHSGHSARSSLPSAGNRTRRRSWLALALCIPLLVAMVITAFEMGKQSARRTDPNPGSTVEADHGDESTSPADSPETKGNIDRDPAAALANSAEPGAAEPPAQDQPMPDADGQQIPESGAERIAGDLKQPPRPERDTTFAKVIDAEDAVWSVEPVTFPRLGSQSLELVSGEAQIEWDEGGAMRVTGPAVLTIGRKFVDVINGTVQLDLPDHGSEAVTIQARDSRIEPDGIARFELRVPEQGLSGVDIDRGAIRVTPWQGRFVGGDPQGMILSPDGFNQLEIGEHSDARPAVARLSGPNDAFEGWVNVNGQVITSPRRKVLDDLYQRAEERFVEAPAALQQEWQTLSRLVADQSPSIAPPGGQFLPPEFQEMRKRMEQMMEEMGHPGFRFPDVNGNGGGFQFSFDGNDFQFQSSNLSPEQQKQLLGSFAEFVDELKNEGPEQR